MPRSSFTAPYRSAINMLVEARKAAGITQVVLASRLEKPQSFVAKFEGLERRLDIIEYVAVIDAIGLSREAALQRLIEIVPRRSAG
jgi:predicted transcriptional regulator